MSISTVVIGDPTTLRPTLDEDREEFLSAIHNHTPITDLPDCQVMGTPGDCLPQVHAFSFDVCSPRHLRH